MKRTSMFDMNESCAVTLHTEHFSIPCSILKYRITGCQGYGLSRAYEISLSHVSFALFRYNAEWGLQTPHLKRGLYEGFVFTRGRFLIN